MSTRTFEFMALLADSRAVVKVSCEIDLEDDCVEIQSVIYEGNSVFDVLSDNQWADLELDALKFYKAEQYEQATIDYDLERSLEAVYGLSKPSFYTR
jgi:hypothetical protein